MAVVSNVLYIFGETNVYALSGYSPETFALQLAVAGIGCPPQDTTQSFGQNVCVCNNKAYFVFEGDLYEFNGSTYPEVISRPVTINGKIANGIGGGIGTVHPSVVAENDYIYVFTSASKTPADTISMQHEYWMFSLESRSWWHCAGLAVLRGSNDQAAWTAGAWMIPFYVTELAGAANAYTSNKGWGILSYAMNDTTNATWEICQDMGYPAVVNPYIITKAFNEGVSEDTTLTQIILHLVSADAPFAYTANVKVNVYYSLTTDGDDFALLCTINGTDLSSDIQAYTINLAGSEISRTHHYRLKIESENANEILIHALERRYRVIGRSR